MKLIRTAVATAAAAGALGLACPLLAHTPYLLPNTFDVERTRVTIQSAQTEDDYFNPDIGLEVPAYVETLPSGQQAEVKPALTLKDVTVTEAPLSEPGTYRFSTGQYVTRKTDLAFIGGKWMFVRQPRRPRTEAPSPPAAAPGAPARAAPASDDGPPNVILASDVPADAKRMETQSIMVAETYVSKGAPTKAALQTTGKGFELKPIDHPNALYVDTGFSFQLLLDGAPVANTPISVYRSGNVYDDRRIAQTLKTDVRGAAKATFAQPGVYLITTHYPVAPVPPGEAPPLRSYTYSLTFEVTR